MKEITKYSIINSFGTAAYIILIVSFIYFLGNVFPEDPKTIITPIAMLMLFVFSAAFTSALFFGRPIVWYLNGKKKDALSLLLYTFGIFLAIIITVFFLLLLYQV